MKIEIDNGSGFCFGVTTAISKAEAELAKGEKLYCLGDIVHNGVEVERLEREGLITINHEQMRELHDVKVLLRAHGEPPETYELARRNNIEIIDATCPVVLQLQRRIKRQYEESQATREVSEEPKSEGWKPKDEAVPQIVIFGKKGHAEVMGLIGQTNDEAIVIERFDEVDKLDMSRDIYLYSQTTKSLDEYKRIIEYIGQHIRPCATFKSFDTICRQVANRMSAMASFAESHDLVIFVSGRKSSNGKVLFNECLRVNANSHQVENASQIHREWLEGVESVGICGATSTPKWLMEECKDRIILQTNDA